MLDYVFLLPISLFLLLGVMSPGPSFILVAQTAMAKSKADAYAVSLGLGVGAIIFATIAAFGLFVLLESVPILYNGLKIAGGSYLCYLAYKMYNSSTEEASYLKQQSKPVSLWKMFLKGLFTQLSNPKTAIVFASAFAAFLPATTPQYGYLLVCLTAFFIDTAWYLLVSRLLGSGKSQQLYAKFKKNINRIGAGFMGLMGIKLITAD
ncbi:MAG: hypothetical protein OFPI_43560 [Osedax symbiont Rs2]|nr:MAG: hypothetical protein OFPI_43560 [Osedax symbiont Rs2]